MSGNVFEPPSGAPGDDDDDGIVTFETLVDGAEMGPFTRVWYEDVTAFTKYPLKIALPGRFGVYLHVKFKEWEHLNALAPPPRPGLGIETDPETQAIEVVVTWLLTPQKRSFSAHCEPVPLFDNETTFLSLWVQIEIGGVARVRVDMWETYGSAARS